MDSFVRAIRTLTNEAVDAVDKAAEKASSILMQPTRDPSKPWAFTVPELVVTFRHCDHALLDCALGVPNVVKECLNILRANPPLITDFRFTLNSEDLTNIYSNRANSPITPSIAIQILAYFLYQLPEPLCTNQLYEAFIACGQIESLEDQKKNLRLLMRELRWEHRPTLFYILKFAWLYVESEKDAEKAETAKQFAHIFGPLLIRKIAAEGALEKTELDSTKVPIIKTYMEGQNVSEAANILTILILGQSDILGDVEKNFKRRNTALSEKEDRLQRITVRQSKMVLEEDKCHLELLQDLWEILRSSTYYEMECRLESSHSAGIKTSVSELDKSVDNATDDDDDNDSFSTTSEIWDFNGFTDPVASFRGGGQLALECMVFMSKTHSEHFISMVRYHGDQRNLKPTFPVHVAGSHITVMLMSLLCLSVSGENPEVSARSLSPQPFWRLLDDEEAFEKLYSLTFMMVDEMWRRESSLELNFNDILERTRKVLAALLRNRPENAEMVWTMWLSQKADAKMQESAGRNGSIERGLSAVTAASAAHALALAQTTDETIAKPLVQATKSLLRSKNDANTSSTWKSGSKNSTASAGGDSVMVKSSSVGDIETKVLDRSEILNEVRCNAIEAALSPSCQGHDWKLLYSLSRDGASIDTFFHKVQGHLETIVLVKDSHETAFGGFASKEWKICSHYFGSGESFVFALKDDGLKKYEWTGKNNYFMLANEDAIAMGGGGNFGIYLDCDLFGGTSGNCETFGSPMLSSQEEFQCASLEVWGLVNSLGGSKC